MGAFGNSLKRELGKNTGKFISNVVFGDMHSTPYRRVDARRKAASEARIAEAEARRRVEEVKKQARLEEARMRLEEAHERAELERKNQLYAIDGAVIRNIDILNSRPIPTDKADLLQMLSEFSVLLKANKWQTNSDEAEIRNKYTDALLEKFTHCVRELEFMDVNEPHLKYYKGVASKAKRNRFIKKNQFWISLLVLLFVLAVCWIIMNIEDVFLLSVLFLVDYRSQLLWTLIVCVVGFVGFKIYSKHRNNNVTVKKEKPIGEKTTNLQNGMSESYSRSQEAPSEESIPEESVFFDLNENERIEKRLAQIWKKYQRLVPGEIMNRKPIFSADGVRDSILYVGVNPSYNPGDDNVFISSTDNQSLMYGSFYQRDDAPEYFKYLEEFASMLGKGYTHINLLYARENDRDKLLRSNSEFIREQLELTYDTIIKVNPVTIIFFSDYCKDMIFGADRWVDPQTEKDGHYILRGTNIPIYFSDDITAIDDVQRMAFIRKIKSII
jgi:hypothetical protein